MIEALRQRSAAIRARRKQDEEQRRKWEEDEYLRKARETQARVDGYRITFLRGQIERQREIDDLSALIAQSECHDDVDPKFAELLEFARKHRDKLKTRMSPEAIAKRIIDLKLMEDDIYIYDSRKL